MYKRVREKSEQRQRQESRDRDRDRDRESETERKRKLIRSIGNFKFFSYFQKESDPPGSAFACL